MIRRFCKGIFTDEYKKTIGVDFLEKATFVDALQEEVRFMLWDTGDWHTVDHVSCLMPLFFSISTSLSVGPVYILKRTLVTDPQTRTAMQAGTAPPEMSEHLIGLHRTPPKLFLSGGR